MKYRLLKNYLFQRKEEHGGWEELQGNHQFYRKLCLPVITRSKKHLSKQVVPIIHTEDLPVVSFQRE